MSTNSGLVVILTALNLEYEAVRDQLTDLRVRRHTAGTRFEVGRIGQSDCRVALGLVGKGNHPAAVLAERAMAEFSPAAVLFVGVAGGLWPNIRLGDVVVASKIYAYHGGTSEDDGLKARPKAWEIPHEADQIAQHVARSAAWRRGLPGGRSTPASISGRSPQARWCRTRGSPNRPAGSASTTTTPWRSRWKRPVWRRPGTSTAPCRWWSYAASATTPTAARQPPTDRTGSRRPHVTPPRSPSRWHKN